MVKERMGRAWRVRGTPTKCLRAVAVDSDFPVFLRIVSRAACVAAAARPLSA
jgi:hypothetical protein